MTQFFTAKDLYDSLAALIADDLGTFSNGIPRLWVKPPAPPAGTAQGLECIIQRVPVGEVRGSSGRQKKDLRSWVVTLTNYADDGSLSSATEKIKAAYPFSRAPRYTPDTDSTYATIQFLIADPILINL